MSRAGWRGVAGADHFHDLGNLLLAFVMLWAYLGFSQFMIIWMENLKEEIPWYLHRTIGGWQIIALALVFFQFALPFVLLLSRAAKRRPRFLAGIASCGPDHALGRSLLVGGAVVSPEGFYFHWLDLAALAGVGGVWAALFLRYIDAHSLVPLRDPRFARRPMRRRECNHGNNATQRPFGRTHRLPAMRPAISTAGSPACLARCWRR